MNLSVVVAAEQNPIVQIGWSVVEPGFDVVGFSPTGWPVAIWERTTKVSMSKCAALGRCVESLGTPEV